MRISNFIKTVVVSCGLYLALAPATFVVNNSINNIMTNNGKNIARMV